MSKVSAFILVLLGSYAFSQQTFADVPHTVASITIQNYSPTNSRVFTLIYSDSIKDYTHYCILENSTTISECNWVEGVLPREYMVSDIPNQKVLSIWLKNQAQNGQYWVIGSRTDTNAVTYDPKAPTGI